MEEKEKELKRKQLELERRAAEIQRKEELHVANKENHQKRGERRKQHDLFNNLRTMVVPSTSDDEEEDFGKYTCRLSVL